MPRFLLAALATLLVPVALAQSFEGLGHLPGTNPFSSVATAVSADGAVVVGASQSNDGLEAFRWENGTMDGLGVLPGEFFGDPFYGSSAAGVSADGSVVVGLAVSLLGTEAFRWEDGHMTGLGVLPGGAPYPEGALTRLGSAAMAVSSDGAVVVGVSESDQGPEAFRWEGGLMTGLGLLPGGHASMATGVEGDGSAVVGVVEADAGPEPFRWADGELVRYGPLPTDDATTYGVAGLSANGRVVVGSYASGDDEGAYRWEGGVLVHLGRLAEGAVTQAAAVSADGSVVVGVSLSEGEPFDFESGAMPVSANETLGIAETAFLWTAATGVRPLQTVLEDEYGLDLMGWRLLGANAVSADGRVIVGYGVNPNGRAEAWRAVLR